jgi:cellulose synthase/poly-beta-1,6-N-acetylglucosamine synthase-like glycosyltransferase
MPGIQKRGSFMYVLDVINIVICVMFLLCYAFQVAYSFIPFIKKLPKHKESVLHKYAVIICARNEEAVLSEIFDSLEKQDYPRELVTVAVVADNCTDATASVARARGAVVYERFNTSEVGKGYALDYGLSMLGRDFGEDAFDAFLVFDADNVLEYDFITEINKTFSDGYPVVTSYRNSKNYGESWLSAGSGLWWLRDSKYLNGSRMRIGACPQVAGTGFLFSNEIKKEYGGWPFHTMTEDYEFTCHSVVRGKRFGYCETARFYDDQEPTFRGAWNQRLRWSKGGIQSFAIYLKELVKGFFSNKFVACYDMAMSIAPAYFISMIACVVNVVGAAVLIALGNDVFGVLYLLMRTVVGAYLLLLTQSILTTATEWRNIKAKRWKKILYIFTWPIYIFTFVPIAAVATFKKVEWKETKHKRADSEE